MSISPVPDFGVTFAPVQSRKRALTKTLLGEQYEEVVTTILDPPQPLPNLSQYTPGRILEGLRYTDTTLRNPHRKISPGGAIALTIYKDACVGLLDMLDVEEGEVIEMTETDQTHRQNVEDCHRAFIREAERGIQLKACMKTTKTDSAQQLQDEILDLQRIAFYARYGDYFSDICNNLKVAAETKKLAGWQTISKEYWSEIAKKVELEKPVYQRSLRGVRGLHDKMPTTHAIQAAAYYIGLHPEETIAIVNQYGIRNDLLHANLLPMIKEGRFADLAHRLSRDRMDIPLLAPASDKADRKILEGLLDSMIDLWFNQDELSPLNTQMWTAKPELRNKYQDLNAETPIGNEAEINRQIAKQITKAFKQNLRKSGNENELIGLFGLITGKRSLPPKRVASSQLEEELARLAKRKREWSAIMAITGQGKDMYDAYVLSGNGEIGEPREIVEDKDL